MGPICTHMRPHAPIFYGPEELEVPEGPDSATGKVRWVMREATAPFRPELGPIDKFPVRAVIIGNALAEAIQPTGASH